MKYLKIFEEYKSKPTILYLHGLDGELDNWYKSLIDTLDVHYVGISTDYRVDEIWDVISKLDVDGVIGHSMGGYLSYFFSNYKKIPCLMFMPCFDKEMFDMQPIPDNILNMKTYKEKIAVIGNLDDEVNLQEQKVYLSEIDTFDINIDHDVPNDVFYVYAKMFIEKYFS